MAPAASGGTSSANPFAGARLYVNSFSNAARTAAAWRAHGRIADGRIADGRIADARALAKIAQHPQAVWFGDWNGADPSPDVRDAVGSARAAGALPVLVAYDIPGRDCGDHSAGGARSATGYRSWIDGRARGIGSGRAVVILEPDAIPELDCMTASAGNRGWQRGALIAARLRMADVAQARGFSLNVSNFDWTSAEEAYGNRISALVGDKHFVVDTSRNGRGPAPGVSWCNPAGRGLGRPATTATGDPLADALLWIKAPGESDGLCNGGPPAGMWWAEYAL